MQFERHANIALEPHLPLEERMRAVEFTKGKVDKDGRFHGERCARFCMPTIVECAGAVLDHQGEGALVISGQMKLTDNR